MPDTFTVEYLAIIVLFGNELTKNIYEIRVAYYNRDSLLTPELIEAPVL